MRTSKKIVSLVLAVLMVASMMVVGVVSASAATVTVGTAADFMSAVNALNTGTDTSATIKLSANVTLEENTTFEIASGKTLWFYPQNFTLDLNGNIIKNEGTLYFYSAGNVTTTNKIINNYGKFTIYKTKMYTTAGNSVAVDNYDGSECIFDSGYLYAHAYGVRVYKSAVLTVKGSSEIYTEAEAFAICGNGSTGNGGYTINIEGSSSKVTSVNDVAIYHCNNGTLNVKYGTITGATAIYVKGGQTNITGGTIIGTGAKHEYNPYGNGAHPTGEAVVFEQHHSYAGLTPNGSNITGGNFQTTGEGVTTVVGSYAEANYGLTAETEIITGGTFNKDVDPSLLADDYSTTLVDGKYVAASDYEAECGNTKGDFADLAGANKNTDNVVSVLKNVADPYVLSAGDTLKVQKNGKTVTVKAPDYYYVTTSTASGVTTYTVAAADYEYTNKSGVKSYGKFSTTTLSGDGTYKLLDDVSLTARLAPGIFASDVTLDLNGHTLTSTATDEAFLFSRAGSAAKHNSYTIKNGTVVAAGDGVDLLANYADLTLENVDIVANGVYGVVTNGTNTGNNITATDSSITAGTLGIYKPSNGSLTLTDTDVTGKTAVYVKSGDVTIDGGTFKGTGDAADYAYNGNGANITGDAVVIDNCGYPGGAPTVTIIDGVFESDNAEAVASYVKQDDPAQTGSFEQVTDFVAGGTYSSDVTDLCVPGLVAQEIGDEQFVIVPFTTDGKADIIGLQQKATGVLTGNDINTQGMRVVTEVDRNWLDEVAEDYGYVVAKTTGLDQAQANFTNLKKDGQNGQKTISCKGSENNIPGYGEDYVTLAVNGMKVDDQFAARFYVVFNGVTYYANYVNTGTYTGIIGTYQDIING